MPAGTVRAVPVRSSSVAELAEDWLTAKRAVESAEQAEKGNSDRARRADLARWAIVIGEARGHSPTADEPPITRLRLADPLDGDVLRGPPRGSGAPRHSTGRR